MWVCWTGAPISRAFESIMDSPDFLPSIQLQTLPQDPIFLLSIVPVNDIQALGTANAKGECPVFSLCMS